MVLFAVVIMMMIVVGLMTAVVAPPCVTEDHCVLPIKHSGVTASCWIGFDWDSALGYDGEGPPSGLETPLETEVWLQQVEEQKRLIEALPVVKRLDFFCDDNNQNLNKVEATLWCCWAGGRLKRIKESCDMTGAKPTHLEAARALRAAIIDKHACAGHVFDHRAVARRAALEAETEAEAATPFDRIRLAQVRQLSAARQASVAEQAAETAREAERSACLVREEAELQARVLRVAADALKPKEPSHKKQRTAFSAGSSSQAPHQGDIRHLR